MAILFQQKLLDHSAASDEEVAALSLTCADRQRHRLAAMLPSGRAVAIVLPRDQTLEPGDLLLSTCGQKIRIEAAPEPLLCVSARTPFELMRLTYHLANRHVKAMLTSDAIFIEPDKVLREMIERLGGQVTTVKAIFLPEPGAYAGGHHHSHHHNEHGEPQALDDHMGQVGESLSIAAHQRRSPGGKVS